MEYIIIGLLIVILILVVMSLAKNINESNITERLGKLETNMVKEIGDFKSDFSKNINDKKLYLNLEALGCPVGTGFAKAGILNFEGENIEYEALDVPYDVEKVKDEIKELKYSFYESVIRIFYDKKGELDG